MFDVFIPTYPDDLPQLSLLIASINRHLDIDAVASLTIAHVGPEDGFPMVSATDTLKFGARTRFLRPWDLGMPAPDRDGRHGWHLQQVAKLSFARFATQPYYMVLDSKNLAIRAAHEHDFVKEGRAATTLEPLENHPRWWRGAAWALGHSSFDTHRSRLVLSAATPVILHTASVRAMVDWLEHRHRTSLANLFLKPRPQRWPLTQLTEFSLYYTFLDREGLFDRYHFQSDLLQDVASQIWQAHSADEREARLRQIVDGSTAGLFTGIQRGAWHALTPEQRNSLRRIASGGGNSNGGAPP